jgi:peptidyl-prolyl cis-trans isomerase D
MLKELRSGAAGFFAKLLLGILVICFAFWGVADVFHQNSPRTVATVGSEDISLAEFEREFSVLRRTFGENMPTSGVDLQMLQRMVLEGMISRQLISLEADRMGLRISDDALAREISRNEEFRNASGEFDQTIFQQTLRQQNIHEAQYLDQLRSSLKQEVLMDIMNGEKLVPAGYANLVYKIEGEVRSVDLLAVDAVKPGLNLDRQEPGEEEIAAYFKDHQTRFTAPEYRTLSVIEVTPDDWAKQVKITRQEVFNLYNERSESLMIPEKRRVKNLLFSTKADAENAYSILRNGKSLKEAISMVAPINKEALDLGLVTKEQLPPEAEKVFQLDKGEFSEPLESRFGWHIYYVDEVVESRVTPFEDVQESLTEELRQQKLEQHVQDVTDQLEEMLAGTDSLAEAAKEAELPLRELEPVDATGHGTDNRDVLPQALNAELLKTAFQLSEGERSELQRRADGGIYVVKVNAITPPRQRTLDEVRGQVVGAWKQERLAKAREEYATDMVAQLAKSPSLEETQKLLKQFTFDRTTDVQMRRNGAVMGMEGVTLPPAMVQEIFALEQPGGVSSAQKVGDGFVIALLRDITPAADPKSSTQSDQALRAVRRKLRTDYRNEILEQYINQLRARYPVRINEAVLARLNEPRE